MNFNDALPDLDNSFLLQYLKLSLINNPLNINLRKALRLETRVKRVIIFSFCIGGTFEKQENRNKIETNSPRDLKLGSYPLPHTSLSVQVLSFVEQRKAEL